MVVVRGERADAFDEKLCVVCVVFEGKRGVCGVSLRRVSIETRLSFHINQSSNRFPGRTFQNDDDDDDDKNGKRRGKATTRTFRARKRRRKRLKTTTTKKRTLSTVHMIFPRPR